MIMIDETRREYELVLDLDLSLLTTLPLLMACPPHREVAASDKNNRVIFHFGPSTPNYSMLVPHIPIWSLRRISVFQLGSLWGGIFHFGPSFSTYIPLWPLSWSYSIMVRTDVVSAL